jgi:hypothetical protein
MLFKPPMVFYNIGGAIFLYGFISANPYEVMKPYLIIDACPVSVGSLPLKILSYFFLHKRKTAYIRPLGLQTLRVSIGGFVCPKALGQSAFADTCIIAEKLKC